MKLAYICLFILGLGTLNASSQNAWASCIEPLTLTEYKNQADFVVIGTASGQISNYHNFSVERYYKGTGPATIKVTGRASDTAAATSVDFDIEFGKKYLLFLEGPISGVLKTNSCSGSREIAGFLGTEEANALGVGTTPIYGSEAQNNQIALGLTALIILLILLKVRTKIFA
jgi:hypothetical protein